MKAIYKRELQAYFHSFLGALFIGATLFLLGIYFSVYDLFMGYPYIGYALSAVVFLFLISIPVLCMRILAEERQKKTDQLILTSPVSVGGIVAGKFLALATVFAIPVVIISFYPVIMHFFGAIDFGKSYVAILGFFLYGLACIAICIFISSLTESQVIAAVISFAILFLTYVMSGICNMISSTGNLLTKILSAFDMVGRFDDLLNGSLYISSIVYYLSVILLFLVFTVQSIQKRRYQLSKKTLSLGTYSTTVVVVMTAAVVLLNVFVSEIPAKYTVFDVTANQLYSLSDETKTLAEELAEDVNIYVLVNESSADATLDQTLKNYEGLSSHIKVSYVDPAVNPKFYTNYTDSSITSNSIIVESSKRSKVIDYSDIYEYEYDYYYYTSSVTGYDGEGQITSAIAYVTSEEMPKIYMLEGHGETAFDSAFIAAVEKENVDYETINLMNYDAVPKDAACVIINAPEADLSDDDAEKMLAYMENGGDVFIVSGYTGEELTNFNSLLAFYGVSVTKGLVIEADKSNYYNDPFYLLPNIIYDTITASVYSSGSYVFAPYSQGLTEEETEDVEVSVLLSASDESYVRDNVENGASYAKQEGDTDGPFDIGVKCVKAMEDEESTAVIYSSAELFTTAADSMVAGTNMKLFTASLGGLVSHESSVSIPVKSLEVEYLTIPQSVVLILAIVTVLIIPLAFIITGFVVWFGRRKR